jgi:hypothetical protein
LLKSLEKPRAPFFVLNMKCHKARQIANEKTKDQFVNGAKVVYLGVWKQC